MSRYVPFPRQDPTYAGTQDTQTHGDVRFSRVSLPACSRGVAEGMKQTKERFGYKRGNIGHERATGKCGVVRRDDMGHGTM